jgi:signal transduction histidine kinase
MIVLGLAFVFNLVFSILMALGRQVFPGYRAWLAGQACAILGAIGYVLFLPTGIPFLAWSIPNTLYFLWALLVLEALYRFRFGRGLPRAAWLSAPLFLGAFSALLGGPVNQRIAFFSLAMCAVSAASAVVLFSGSRRESRASLVVMGVSFAVSAAGFAVRAADALASPPFPSFYAEGGVQSVLILVSILVAYMTLFGYFMMSGSRFELELREKDGLIERRNAELRRLDEINLTMMSVIAHDLRSPVGGAARYVRRHLLPPGVDLAAKRDEIAVLGRTLDDTDALLESLLMWARDRAAGDEAAAERAAFAIGAAVRPALEMIGEQAAEKGVEVAFARWAELEVLAERNGCAVVFRNLLSNSLKFTSEGGRIEVEAREEGGMVVAIVSDTGCGMDAASVERLNGGAALASSPGTEGERGMGLGLSLCRRFMARQGGTFRAESVQGEGSRFFLGFPAPAPAARGGELKLG